MQDMINMIATEPKANSPKSFSNIRDNM